MRIALIGAGPAAINHVRVVNESPRAKLDVVIDDDLERAEVLADKAGCIMAPELDGAQGCQAAIVTTPPETHGPIATRLIEMGIPVLVETPLAPDIDEARQVVESARAHGVPLTCGFVERFNPVVRVARSLLDEAPRHILAVRHSAPNPRTTTNVVHDLMIHDIDLAIQFGGGVTVESVQAATFTPPGAPLVELADAVITFPSLVATLSASRLGHREVRTMALSTTNKLMELDLLRQHVTVYRHMGHDALMEGLTPVFREHTVVDTPFVRHSGEPLAVQLDQFLDLAEGRLDMGAIRNGLLPAHNQAAKVLQR